MATATSALRFDLFVRDRTRDGVDSASRRFGGLAKAGLAIGAVGAVVGSAINKAAQFDKTIRVAGAAANATGEDMKAMSKLALEMGSKTQFGAQGAADAMVELSKAGMSIAEQRAGALAETLLLASAGGLELGNAATFMTNALNTFGIKTKDAARVSTALAGGANASTASVESLGMALSQVGPGAKNAGLSLEETVATLAAFDQAGVKGSDAGTSLKTMLTRLVPTTDKAAGAMKDLGLDFTKANGDFVGITEVAEQLRKKMGGLSEEQRTQRLATIFGSDATRAASILIDNGAKGLQKYIDATKDRTAAEKAAAAQTDGAAGNMKKFGAAVDSLQIAFALHLLPAITDVMGGLTGLVNKITGKVDPAMNAIKDTINDTVVPAFNSLKTKASDALSGIDFSGVATDLAGEASKWATSLIDGVRQGFDDGDWGQVGRSVGAGVGDALESTGNLAVTIFGWIGEQIRKVNWLDLGVQMGKQAPALAVGFALGLLNFDLMSVLSGLGDHWFEVILGILTLAFLPAKVVGAIAGILARIPIIGPLVSWMFRAVQGAASGMVSAGGRLLASFGSGLLAGIRRVFPQAGAGIAAGITRLMSAIASRGTGLILLGVQLVQNLLRGLAAAPGFLARKGGEMIGSLLAGIVRAVPRVLSWVRTMPGKIVAAVGAVGAILQQHGSDFIQGFINGIKQKATELPGLIRDSVVGVAKSALHGFGLFGSPSRLTRKYGQWWTQGFALGMKDWKGKATDQAQALIDKLKEKMDRVKEFAKEIRDQFAALANPTGIDTMIRNDRLGIEEEGGIGKLLETMRKRVGDAERFAKAMISLRAAKLNPTTLEALRAAGPEGGLVAAEQILGGGKAAITELNQLSAALARVGSQFATAEAKAKFGVDPNAKATATIKGGGQTIRLVLDPSKSGDKLTRAVVDSLREWVRVNGRGDVQVALGAAKKK